MKKQFYLQLVVILATNCNAKNPGTLTQEIAKPEMPQDTIKPKESWKVNKELDKNENVVKYGSTRLLFHDLMLKHIVSFWSF
ncbi:MAG: hypothetical protein WBF67_10155 [Olleya sp.]